MNNEIIAQIVTPLNIVGAKIGIEDGKLLWI